MNAVRKYLAEIGQRGGKAGRGASKARSHEQAVVAGRKGGLAAANARKMKRRAAAHTHNAEAHGRRGSDVP